MRKTMRYLLGPVDFKKAEKKQWIKVGPPKVEKNNVEQVGPPKVEKQLWVKVDHQQVEIYTYIYIYVYTRVCLCISMLNVKRIWMLK